VPVVDIRQIDGVLEMPSCRVIPKRSTKKSKKDQSHGRLSKSEGKSSLRPEVINSSEEVGCPGEKLAVSRIVLTKDKAKPKASNLVQNCRTKQNKKQPDEKKDASSSKMDRKQLRFIPATRFRSVLTKRESENDGRTSPDCPLKSPKVCLRYRLQSTPDHFRSQREIPTFYIRDPRRGGPRNKKRPTKVIMKCTREDFNMESATSALCDQVEKESSTIRNTPLRVISGNNQT